MLTFLALLLLDTPISSLILFPSVSLALNPNLRDVGGMEILYLVLDGVFVLVRLLCGFDLK